MSARNMDRLRPRRHLCAVPLCSRCVAVVKENHGGTGGSTAYTENAGEAGGGPV